jgi:colicin import membrane protein
MEITIFKEITTEGVIKSIEENSEKYHVGFYADMKNAPERKQVKESASEIGGIIKELEVARIKITKGYTAKVNKEHKAILERLKVANAPFQVLIDEYTAQRKKILADEKYVVEMRAAMVQKEDDHEMALLINKTFEYEKSETIRINNEQLHAIKVEAERAAEERQRIHNETVRQNEINAENERLANKEYCAKINNTILACLINEGFDEHEAKKFIRLAAQNKLPQLTINY